MPGIESTPLILPSLHWLDDLGMASAHMKARFSSLGHRLLSPSVYNISRLIIFNNYNLIRKFSSIVVRRLGMIL